MLDTPTHTHDVVYMVESSMALAAQYGACSAIWRLQRNMALAAQYGACSCSNQRWLTYSDPHSGVIFSRRENDLVYSNVRGCLA